MTARSTYEAAITATGPTKTAALTANQTAAQETINAAGVNVGYNLQTGNFANLAAAVKTATQAKLAADFAVQQAQQATMAAARDALRATGDLGAF